MRGFPFWLGDAFAHAMGAWGWEEKRTIPPSIGLKPLYRFSRQSRAWLLSRVAHVSLLLIILD